MQTVHFEVVSNAISSRGVSNSTSIAGRIVDRCHGDLQMASIQRDPDVRVVFERKARTVAEPDEPRCWNSVCDAVECMRLASYHDQ